MEEIIKEFLKVGITPTLLLVLLYLIIQEPDRVEKIRSLITLPFFRIFKWFSKTHISSKVATQINEFLNSSIFSELTHSENFKIKVKWVENASDPIFKETGTLILRMKEENDQTKNILSAVHTALPHIICPLIRKNLNQTFEKSIDLAILKKLSNKLGRHGKIIFKKYFLDPETDLNSKIRDLLQKLQQLDEYGFFVPIFLNELELLSEELYSENDQNDYSQETLEFLEYLLTIVNREIGENIQLEYLSSPFKVSTIFLARSIRAETNGLRPYLRRLEINLDKGSETIYIIAFPTAFDFFKRLLPSLESHDRIFVKKIVKTVNSKNKIKSYQNLKIAILTRNEVYSDKLFEVKLEENNILVGSKVSGIVDDVSQNEAIINILGIRAHIVKSECSWLPIESCKDVLLKDTEYEFIVKKIDKSTSMIYLSMKFVENDPWKNVSIPIVGELIEVEFKFNSVNTIKAIFDDKLEVEIKHEELTWFLDSDNHQDEFIGLRKFVKVIEIDNVNHRIFCSLRQTIENPWPLIQNSLPINTELNGKVSEITDYYVRVMLPNNYFGIIPKESLEKAGNEYINFKDNVVIGQGIDVYVSKIFLKKQKIRLDLVRNKNKS
ncbi:MAG: hypothetical protein RLY15_198 [Bacteroidota bacterium]|jgi:predicted RNA-binding protein with RPS1 domain